ncbi:unnamed protein product [Brassicogethes aeneus]|uniref:Uncharacterized protein n=1 Tax=Brassicogethes aeneus TaxID=1431903 RepID=A0A9P0FMD0_BRAAE|nr:unnamed protein product [Brassicogethes aeneus]
MCCRNGPKSLLDSDWSEVEQSRDPFVYKRKGNSTFQSNNTSKVLSVGKSVLLENKFHGEEVHPDLQVTCQRQWPPASLPTCYRRRTDPWLPAGSLPGHLQDDSRYPAKPFTGFQQCCFQATHRSTDAMRERKGRPILDAYRAELRRKLLGDETGELEIALNNMQLPSATAALLSSVGKVEADGRVWHSIFPELPEDPEQQVVFRTLCINVTNIRQLVVALADPNTPLASREYFIAHNSLPGANFQNALLQNPDDIWPEIYDIEDLQEDIHAYNNLLTRIGPRMPGHFLTIVEWSGSATESALACSDVHEMRIQTQWEVQPVRERGAARRRDVRGRLVAAEQHVALVPTTERIQGRQASLH